MSINTDGITDRNGLEVITDIQEKKAISNKANTGAYVFPSVKALHHNAAEVIDANYTAGPDVGEYYTSQIIAHMLHSGITCVGLRIPVEDVCCLGTPQQLQHFLRFLKDNKYSFPAARKKRRFCFDLDMTLVGSPAISGDYSTCPPLERNIRLVQDLHAAGHHIIIVRTLRSHWNAARANVKPPNSKPLAA